MTRPRDLRQLAVIAIVGLIILFVAPATLEVFTLINLATAVSLAVLALSLGLIWGYGGILCFGQTAFYGVGAYAYAVAAINFGDTTAAVPIAIVVAAGFAAALGYFVFYGRVSDVYLAVITLTVTLILYNLVRHTSGPEYKIGTAPLGGFNGVTAPPLNLPGDPTTVLYPEDVFVVAMVVLLLAYFGCVWLTRSHFGRVIVSIRENELRAELLGYDIRLYKLVLFAIGGGLAGIAGILFANAVGRITPDMFNLFTAALTIIWVIVGGRGTLIGPILGAVAIYYLTSQLGTQAAVNNNLILGAILIVFVLAVPRGLVPSLGLLWRRLILRRGAPARRSRRRRAPLREAADEG